MKTMRYFILILCLVQVQVQATDWLNSTVRVDLIVNPNRTAFDPQYELFERSERFLSGVNATRGQYPWSIMIGAWGVDQFGNRFGIICSGTIISNNFILTDLHCAGIELNRPTPNSIETYIGSVQYSFLEFVPTNFVRHYWYINSTLENSPNIVLLRLHVPLTFNPNVQPIRLPSYKDFSYEAWSSYTLGFQTPPLSFSGHLQSAHISILNNSQCNFSGYIAEHEICGIAGSDPRQSGPEIRFDVFTGGAMIVYEYTAGFEFIPVLVGIHRYEFANQTASFGRGTRVSHFVDWIETLAGELVT